VESAQTAFRNIEKLVREAFPNTEVREPSSTKSMSMPDCLPRWLEGLTRSLCPGPSLSATKPWRRHCKES
jgi:hypothetical protein